MSADFTPMQSFLKEHIDGVIDVAAAAGFVVTIELRPREPLAMGNYEMISDVRPQRERT